MNNKQKITPLIALAIEFVEKKLTAEVFFHSYMDLYNETASSKTTEIESSIWLQVDRYCPEELSDCKTDDDLDEEQLRYVVQIFLESKTSENAYKKLGHLG